MGCDIDFEVLMAYLDGELNPIDRGRVAEHIVACEACRDTVSDLRAVSGALTKWVVPEPANLPTARELLDRAGAARPAEVVRPVWRGVVVRWAAVAALAVVAVTIAAVVLNRSSEFDRGSRGPSTVSDAPRSEAPPPPIVSEKANPAAPSASQPPAASNVNSAAGPQTVTSTQEETRPTDQSDDKSTGERNDAPKEAEKKDAPDGVETSAGAPAVESEPTPAAEAPKPAAAAAPAPPPVAAPSGTTSDSVAKQAGPGGLGGFARPSRSNHDQKEKRADLSIKSDVLTIEARDVDSAVSAVESAAKAAGGSLASRGSSARRDGGRSVTLIVSVPVERYEALVGKIKGVGRVKAEMPSSRDVGEAIDALDDREDADRQREKMVEQTKTATIRVTLQEP